MAAINKLRLFGENSTNIVSDADWEENTDRKSGFVSGNAANAKNVNTAIKSNSLVALALSNIICENLASGELSITSLVSNVSEMFKTGFNNALTISKTLDAVNGDRISIALFGKTAKSQNVTNAAHAAIADVAEVARRAETVVSTTKADTVQYSEGTTPQEQGLKFVVCTASQYSGMTKDNNTLYFIKES